MEDAVAGMHVQLVYVEVVRLQAQGLEHLLQRQVLAVPKDDHLVRLLLELVLDEAQQVLLVHAGAVVHVGVHLNGSCATALAIMKGNRRP